jgi:RimJ/RimL family protein N-acetyltransferase
VNDGPDGGRTGDQGPLGRALRDDDLPVETARLRLRRYREADAGSLLELFSDPDVVRYLYTEPVGPGDVGGSLAKRLGPVTFGHEGDELKLVAELRDSGEFVGEMSLFHRSDRDRRGEIGYVVGARFAGRGLATEGAVALCGLGFEIVGFHRIEAQCDARNLASARVMERLGMRREAHLRENEFVKGEWTDGLLYAVLAEEWRGRGRSAPAR